MKVYFFLLSIVIVNGLCLQVKAASTKDIGSFLEGTTWRRMHPKSTTDRSIYEYVTFLKISEDPQDCYRGGMSQTVFQSRDGQKGPVIETYRMHKDWTVWSYNIEGTDFDVYPNAKSDANKYKNTLITLTDTILEFDTVNITTMASIYDHNIDVENLSYDKNLMPMSSFTSNNDISHVRSKYKRQKQTDSLKKMNTYPWLMLAKNELARQLVLIN